MQIQRNPSLLVTGARTLRAGFTLIELLAVILILGLLATFVTPKILEEIFADLESRDEEVEPIWKEVAA